jgi:hypothetical protein
MAFQKFIHTYNLIQQWCLVNDFDYFDFLGWTHNPSCGWFYVMHHTNFHLLNSINFKHTIV